ncbi:MAG TPA: PHP domain-containing protein, partial [Steroidobacteraceae bacterium]|nr:PHP domain-containing protein [Steroidobacteraceae bacterium]
MVKGSARAAGAAAALPDYAELHCLSNFTFLRGASHPEELVVRARELGYAALALTDECSVAGVVRAHTAAKESPSDAESAAASAGSTPLRLIIGTECRLACGLKLVALAQNRQGYARLCRLITRGRRQAPKGEYALTRADVESSLEHCLLLWLPGEEPDRPAGEWLQERFRDRVWLAVELARDGTDRTRLGRLTQLAQRLSMPLVASGNVHMHVRERHRLQDALTAIRLGVPIDMAGRQLQMNGERYLRERARLARLYPEELLTETLAIAERCRFSLDELRYEYPREIVPPGETPQTYLRKLTEKGALERWPRGVPDKARKIIAH